MADVTYRIVIENADGGGSGSGNGISSTTNGDSMNPLGSTPVGDFANGVKAFINVAPVAFALKGISMGIDARINRVELQTGHSNYQQQLQFNASLGSQVLGMVGMVALGIATGHPLAALTGVTTMMLTKAMQYGIAREDLNIQRRVENIGIDMANLRAGAGGDRFS